MLQSAKCQINLENFTNEDLEIFGLSSGVFSLLDNFNLG